MVYSTSQQRMRYLVEFNLPGDQLTTSAEEEEEKEIEEEKEEEEEEESSESNEGEVIISHTL